MGSCSRAFAAALPSSSATTSTSTSASSDRHDISFPARRLPGFRSYQPLPPAITLHLRNRECKPAFHRSTPAAVPAGPWLNRRTVGAPLPWPCRSALGEQHRNVGDATEEAVPFAGNGRPHQWKHHQHPYPQQQQVEEEEVDDGFEEEEEERQRERKRRLQVVVAAVVTVVLGTCNRVLYKLALVPLKRYPFFLAQLATFGYVAVYFSILYCRYRAGIVTDEMFSVPKAPFLIVGLLEALGAACGMAAGAVLSGVSIPILSQTSLVWQLILSATFLGRRYRTNQVFGCFLVSAGVILTVLSGSGGGLSLKNAGIFWTLLMITSFLFQAADTVVKEIIFLDASRRLKEGVDLFVVNSFGSACQALFICLLVPFLSKLWGVPFNLLPTYIRDGAGCFLNMNVLSNECQGAPLLPILFVIFNMAFNISLLHLLKISSAVVSCLASTFSVPLSIYAFTLPLPYLGASSSLSAGFVAGVIVLVTGLLLYCWTPIPSKSSVAHTKSH